MNMNEVYTELIMEHNNSGHNHRVLEDYSKEERGHNPSCGDDITLRVKIENGIIEDAAFSGVGCAISKASASMMIDLIRGKSTQEALDYVHKFFGMIKKEIIEKTGRM